MKQPRLLPIPTIASWMMPIRVAATILVFVGMTLPGRLSAQSDDNSAPLGDIARALRKNKEQQAQATTETVIDNDNFSQVMKQAEKDRQKGDVRMAFAGIGKDLQVSSPDVTCNLSFNAKPSASSSDPFVPQDLPLDVL